MVLGTNTNNKGSATRNPCATGLAKPSESSDIRIAVLFFGYILEGSLTVSSYLVISALGHDRPGIIEHLTRHIVANRCNIHDTRMTVLGGEFALLMLASGAEDALASLESGLPKVAGELSLTTMTRRTNARQGSTEARPYRVEVVALDHPGIVHEIARFFSTHKINIEEMDTATYAAAHTGSPMFSLELTINVPADISFRNLREDFLDFCDERNLDATIEPRK